MNMRRGKQLLHLYVLFLFLVFRGTCLSEDGKEYCHAVSKFLKAVLSNFTVEETYPIPSSSLLFSLTKASSGLSEEKPQYSRLTVKTHRRPRVDHFSVLFDLVDTSDSGTGSLMLQDSTQRFMSSLDLLKTASHTPGVDCLEVFSFLYFHENAVLYFVPFDPTALEYTKIGSGSESRAVRIMDLPTFARAISYQAKSQALSRSQYVAETCQLCYHSQPAEYLWKSLLNLEYAKKDVRKAIESKIYASSVLANEAASLINMLELRAPPDISHMLEQPGMTIVVPSFVLKADSILISTPGNPQITKLELPPLKIPFHLRGKLITFPLTLTSLDNHSVKITLSPGNLQSPKPKKSAGVFGRLVQRVTAPLVHIGRCFGIATKAPHSPRSSTVSEPTSPSTRRPTKNYVPANGSVGVEISHPNHLSKGSPRPSVNRVSQESILPPPVSIPPFLKGSPKILKSPFQQQLENVLARGNIGATTIAPASRLRSPVPGKFSALLPGSVP